MKKIFALLCLLPLWATAQTFPVNNLQINGVVSGNVSGAGNVLLQSNPTVLGSFTATGLVTTADLASQAANTVLANVSGSVASPTAFVVPSCSTSSSALNWTTSTGFTCNTAITAATLGGATFASPPPIGNITANTGNFTALQATTSNPALNYLASGTGAVARSYASKFGDELNVKDFGATGNGSTDDTAAEQAAITAACVSGGTVYWPPGTFKTSALTISCSNIALRGAGVSSTIITTASTTGNLFSFTGANNQAISDMQITYTGAPTAGAAVNVTNVNYFSMDRVRTLGAFTSVYDSGGAIHFYNELELDNTVATTGVAMIFTGFGNDEFLHGIVINAPSGSQPSIGIEIINNGGIWIDAADVIHSGVGLFIAPQLATDSVTWAFVSNSAFDTNSGYGIEIAPVNASSVVKGLTFTGSWSSSNSVNGVFITGAGSVDGVNFVGQRVYNNGQDGFVINTGGGSKTNISFNAGDVAGNSQSSSGTYSGISIGAGVSGFAVRDTRSGQEAGFGNTQKFNILVNAGASNNYEITGNDVRGNVTTGISDNGTGSTKYVSKNIGYNPFASTAITVGASPFTYTNNFGDTITVIIAGGTVSSVTMTGLAIVTATNTSIAIPQGQSIVVTYSSTPTMTYIGH